ncbi:MAG TPA: hypothetical protein PK191_02585 [Niabella sp.]|nr:hypothetical protein [Niabella sp.]HOZ96787.1 hypothetical protein [Niabella sp.]HQW14736.1 hypothetical protein [Niabella sp.]HQX20012.1 hypothetical protein [Niabella sp.]HQX40632.1 hypothetical protein [Niabella sp.]
MNAYKKYYPVNWTEGMKLNKDIFIAQDQSVADTAYQLISTTLHPLRYGLLPGSDFDIQISIDNQNTVRATILNCNAITIGGLPIEISGTKDNNSTDGNPSVSLPITVGNTNTFFWLMVMIEPFDRVPYGIIDMNESPARYPFVKPSYKVILVENNQLNQFALHPQALVIGKIIVNGATVQVDENYLPPCLSVSASPDLMGLHAELDSFLAGLEQSCSVIVQKIYKKSQQNDLSELSHFLCDRMMLYLGHAITEFRWLNIHEPPAVMLSAIVSLARTIKNTIDLRIGAGKEELMNYLCEWCEVNQGELESMLSSMAQLRYNHNDVNENINQIVVFAKIIGKLFATLSNLEFIGKRKESGLFVKEETNNSFTSNQPESPKPKRRFFG